MVATAVLLFVLSLSISSSADDALSCSEKGFSTDVLCSSCEDLKKFNLLPIVEDCLKCCQSTSDEEKVPYYLIDDINFYKTIGCLLLRHYLVENEARQ